MIGRVPVAEEFQKNGPAVIVLSDGLWRRQFGGDPAVVGRTVQLNGRPYRVSGVMPRDFVFPGGTELWMPLAIPFGFDIMEAFRNFLPSQAVARLAPGATIAQAAQHVDALRRRFRKITSDDLPAGKLVQPLQGMLLGERRTALLILAGSAGVLLLIACANVTNLLLARAAARQREIAVRVVLGATRGRIIRQLTVESFLLAVIAAVLAVAVSFGFVRALAAALPQGLASIAPPTVDARVLSFTLLLALVTSIVFGLWPALGASRADLGEAMKAAGAGGGGTRRTNTLGRGLLVVAEVSLAVVLLVGAGLMLESLSTLLSTDSGVHPEQLVTGRLALPASRFRMANAKAAFLEDVAAKLRAVPGVTAVGAVSALPMEGAGGIGLQVFPEGEQSHSALAAYLMAAPGYFRAIGAPLRGEDLPRTYDSTNKVVIINNALAKELWPNVDPVGRRLAVFREVRTVIGVVGDIRTRKLDEAATGQMYLPMAEQPQSYASIVVRGTLAPPTLLARLRDAVRATDPTEPVYGLKTMDEVIASSVAPRRTSTVLLTLFGGLAVLLAAAGVYAVLSYGVAQRTREIGVRVALGAESGDVVRLVLWNGIALAGIGIAIGLGAAFSLAKVASSMLYEVSPHDPRVFVGAPLVLALTALFAMVTPAARAARVDPLDALRSE